MPPDPASFHLAGAASDATAEDASADVLSWLTAREIEVLRAVTQGMSAKQIAKALAIAPRTVERHIDHIRLKTRTRNRAHMVAFALEQGLDEGR